LNNWEDAVSAFRNAIAVQPKSVDAQQKLSISSLKLADSSMAK